MSTALNFPPAGAPLLFDISPLTWLRQQVAPRLGATRWPQYTVVLVEAAGATNSPMPPANQLLSELYFGRPGELPLSAVPARAQGQVLRFTDEFVDLAGRDRELLLFQLFHRSTAGPLRVFGEQASDMALLLSSMKRQAAGGALLREDLLRSYLKTLLLYCTRLSQQQGGAQQLVQSGLLGRFQQLLEMHYTKWKSVTEYAEHLQVTANHLSVCIRKETGQPASAHIRQRIVLEAKRLVSRSDMPLKEVAYLLGFEDVAHFSKLFKRCTGTTFSDFKKQVRARYSSSISDVVMA